ncbi:MAG: PKD-like domain-containing protein [Bacteroidia bacterium]
MAKFNNYQYAWVLGSNTVFFSSQDVFGANDISTSNGEINTTSPGFSPANSLWRFASSSPCGTIASNPVIKTGNVSLKTQTDLDNFLNTTGEKYTHIQGYLELEGNDASDPITDLCNLEEIQVVDGSLRIYLFDKNGNPTDLSQFTKLDTVKGRLRIQQNTQLTGLDFPALRYVKSEVLIMNNNKAGSNWLIGKKGTAHDLTIGGPLTILDNGIDTVEIRCHSISMNQIPGIQRESSIQRNQTKHLHGQVWDKVFGGFSIGLNPHLQSIDLDVHSFENAVSIFTNGSMLNVAADYTFYFHRITGNMDFFTNNNLALELKSAPRSFNTLPNNDSSYITGRLKFDQNTDLRKIVADKVAIINDGTVAFRTEGLELLNLNMLATGNFTQTLTEVSFKGLKVINGSLEVSGTNNRSRLTNAIQLDFSNLEETGSFNIENCFNQDLHFASLKKVVDLTIKDNPLNCTKAEFPELSVLSGISTGFDFISIDGNGGLVSVSFPKLTSVGRELRIVENPEFLNFDSGFPALQSIRFMLTVRDNAKLAQCCIAACLNVFSKDISNNTGNCADLITAQTACSPSISSYTIIESLDPNTPSDSTICEGDPITLQAVADLGGRADTTVYFTYYIDLDQNGEYQPLDPFSGNGDVLLGIDTVNNIVSPSAVQSELTNLDTRASYTFGIQLQNGSRIRVAVRAKSGGICRASSGEIVLGISNSPSISNVIAQNTACAGRPVVLEANAFDNGSGPLTYTWSTNLTLNQFTPNASAYDTTSYLPNLQTTTGIAWAYLSVKAQNGCTAQDSVQFTVVSGPAVSNFTDSTCSGTALNIDLDALLSGTGDIYSYTVSSSDQANVAAGPARATASSLPISDSYTNTTGSDVFITYTVTPIEAGGCIGEDFSVVVKVKSVPVGAGFTATAMCSGATANVSLVSSITNGMSGLTYSWQAVDNPAITGESISATSGATINDVLTNTGNAITNVSYTVTPTAGNGCTGAPFTVMVPVDAVPAAPDTTVSICGTGAVAFDLAGYFAAKGNAGSSTFSWEGATVAGVSGVTTTSSSTATIADVLNNSSGSTQTIVYTVNATNDATSCIAQSFKVNVTLTTLAPPLAESGCTGCGEIRISATQNGTAPNLETAVMGNPNYVTGASLIWYDDNSGSLGSQLAATPVVNTSLPGARAWWVQQATAPGCVSNPIRVEVNIPMASPPGVTASICPGQSLNIASLVRDYTLQASRFDFYTTNPASGATRFGTSTAFRGVARSNVMVSPTVATLYWVRTRYRNGTFADGSILVNMSASCGAPAPAAIALEGAWDASSGNQRASLQAANLLPAQEPYTGLGYSFVNGGGEQMLPAAQQRTDLVDWVIVELRDSANATNVVYSQAALLRADGMIVDMDGTSSLYFSVPNQQAYYLAVLHRNHLGVMTATAQRLGTLIDFSDPHTATYGSAQSRSVVNGKALLYAGDADQNGQIQNTDNIMQWIPQVGSSGYQQADFNLDGQVQNSDLLHLWKPNTGRGSAVPR